MLIRLGTGYTLKLNNFNPNMTDVQFCTWTDEGGQDDIVRHIISLGTDGTYTDTIKKSDHGNQTGVTYLTDVWANVNGTATYIGGVSISL